MIAGVMPDMLARLYDLPDAAPHEKRVANGGFRVRRAEPWDRGRRLLAPEPMTEPGP